MTSRTLGYLQLIGSGFCFGFLGFFGKTAYQAGISPQELLALRYTLSTLLMGALLFVYDRQQFRLSPKLALISMALGIFGYALFSSLYFQTLTQVSASITVLLLYTFPFFVYLGDLFFMQQRFAWKSLATLALSLLGMIFLVWGEWHVSSPWYLLLGLGSAFFYAIYILISRKALQSTPPLISSFYVQLGAGLVLSAVAFSSLDRPLLLISQHGVQLFSMAFICSVLAMSLFLLGLQKVSPTEASILSTTEPLAGVIIATTLLGERLQLLQYLGGIILITSVALLTLQYSKK